MPLDGGGSGSKRFAIFGAGAVAKIFYLPVFRRGLFGAHLTRVVEPSPRALVQLGPLPVGAVAIESTFQAYFDGMAPSDIDAVVVALPHHLHEACVVAALERGLHVFCEKPLGLSSASVSRMLGSARKAGRILAVCQPRREFAPVRAIGQLLGSGRLGPITAVRWCEGQPYAWPAESLSQILQEHGGEELYDIGAHVFDLLVLWFGELVVKEYSDDSLGGTAAEYRIELQDRGGAPITVELSRLHPLGNFVEIVGEQGTIHWNLKNLASFDLELRMSACKKRYSITPESNGIDSMLLAVSAQLGDFVEVIAGGEGAIVQPEEAQGSISILESCKRLGASKRSGARARAGQLSIVTGASGFIGARLVEMLEERGQSVIAVARRPQSCVRLARLGVPIEIADVRDEAQLDRVFRGDVDVIYHCAVASGSQQVVWATVVEGTMNVLRAAERASARRVVIFSSMLALGNPPSSGDVNDETVANRSELDYANAKAEMERRCREFARNSRVEIVILRPTCVFGPFGRDFGSAHLDRQVSGEFFLLEAGRGNANLVYVDNLVDAAMRAATASCRSGSTFLINEEEWPSSWAEFFIPQMREAFDNASVLPQLSSAELVGLAVQHRRSRSFPTVVRQAIRNHPACAEWLANHALFRVWKFFTRMSVSAQPSASAPAHPEGQAGTPHSSSLAELQSKILQARTFPYGAFYQSFFATSAVYRSGKARQELGWRPRVDRESAMEETLAWIRRAYPRRSPADLGLKNAE